MNRKNTPQRLHDFQYIALIFLILYAYSIVLKINCSHIKSFILLAGICNGTLAQNFITNPGFEGPDGIEVIPEDWFSGCGVMNTPDTQPGWWNIENKPYQGNAYINLLFKEDGTTESVYQKLAEPLTAGSCYIIEIYLAQACQDSISDLFPYDLNHPGDLIIRGSTTYGCNNGQVLAEFKQISNCQWKARYSIFQADSTINYIYLEFSKGTSLFPNGSVLIDQFILEDMHPFPDEVLELNYESSIQLNSKVKGTGYQWFQNDSLIASDTSSVTLLLEANSIVTLSYTADDGCVVNEKFILHVKPKIPNIITPLNQDGINDVFFIFGLIENATLYVMNRWGEVVYVESGYKNKWSPQDLTPGVYFYRLDLHDSNRTFQGAFYIQ